MAYYFNNLFDNNFSLNDIIDKKRLEKNIDITVNNDDEKESEKSVGARILTSIMFLAQVIFLIIFIVLITSNLSFLITCGRTITAVGTDGKKRSFNDLWFPSYYFYQESEEINPLCQGLKLNPNGFFKGFKFSSGLPLQKYLFDFVTFSTSENFGIIGRFVNYMLAVSKKTGVLINARIIDLLQIIGFFMPNDPFYRNLILFFIGIPLIFVIISLSTIATSIVYISNLLITDFPINILYLLFLSFVLLIMCNLLFPFIFLTPFELFFFPLTSIVYALLTPFSFVALLIIFSFFNSFLFNIITLIKLMFAGYLAGGYKAISKNAQENKKMYMFITGLTVLLSIISIAL